MSSGGAGAPRRLYRSRLDRKMGGVCGGIAEYFGIDPVIVRLLWVAVTIVSMGAGILLYIIALLVVPSNPHQAGPQPVA
ncbi:MAG: PspC domain-containing protein [Acidobacteria bacterium]|nr:PspC domain-containing protein [Acidobacteriota bacterium]